MVRVSQNQNYLKWFFSLYQLISINFYSIQRSCSFCRKGRYKKCEKVITKKTLKKQPQKHQKMQTEENLDNFGTVKVNHFIVQENFSLIDEVKLTTFNRDNRQLESQLSRIARWENLINLGEWMSSRIGTLLQLCGLE